MKNFFIFLWYKYKDWRWERKCIKHLGMKPQKMYVSVEDYDKLVEAINSPPKPSQGLIDLMNRPSPFDKNE